MSKTKKMRNKTFLGIWVPCLTVAAAVAIALPIVAYSYKTILNTYVNHGETIVTPAEGTESWDSTYNKASVKTKAEAVSASESEVEKICNEGFVLLKNKDNSLPISTSTEITMLGRDSVDPIYGGSGSGTVDKTKCATPKSGLEKAGFSINSAAYDFYNSNYTNYPRANIVMDKPDSSTYFAGEIPANTVKAGISPVTGDTAVVFIGRGGGEGGDLSTNLKDDITNTASTKAIADSANAAAEAGKIVAGQHQLELTQDEKDLINWAKTTYAKTVIVLNSSNIMEMGDLNSDDAINAIIWVGSPGATGFNSLGSILKGSVNPSGHTADIWPADFTADPTFKNFAHNGVNKYSDVSNVLAGDSKRTEAHFVEYEEGIYVGYRYYETRYGADETAYKNAVVYPFGYGLSYSSFTEKIKSHTDPGLGEDMSVTVTVTNTGSVAGKQAVELYVSAPYTKGGIQKSAVSLVGYAKTSSLAAGASEDVTISFKKEDLASYDYKTNKCYVVEGGNYTFSVRSDSHTVADSYTTSIGETKYTNGRPSDKTKVTNQFDDVSGMFKDTATSGYALNMSRDDFSGTFPTLPTDADAVAANITIEGKTVQASLAPYANSNVADDVAPTKNASNGLSLIDMRGSDYDDPAWDVFLNQMTDDDYTNAANYICNNAYNTPAITSLGKPATVDHDGPAGFTSLFGSLGNCAWMSEVVMASTWNQDLAKEMGECIGDEALMGDGTSTFAGWYGPAMNTHRSAFAGRNFEYYSENGVLGGYIGASVVSGAADKGCYAYIKHFALNDQEYCRTVNVCTWANEQAIREIYLKPFEITVKKATATESYISDSKGTMSTKTIQACQGVMTSFNRVGTTWAGGSKALCTNVLRNEWGFRGVGISDFNLYNYMVPDQGMRAGTDMQLTWASFKDQTFNDLNTATEQLAIRNAVKNVCFSVSNSLAMNGVVPGSIITYTRAPWEWWIIGGDIALSVLVLAGAGWVTYRTLKYKKEGGDEGHAEPSESKAA